MVQPKADIAYQAFLQGMQRIRRLALDLIEFFDQAFNCDITNLSKDCVFIGKIDIEPGRGYSDTACDSTNRRRVIAMLDKQLLGCVKDLCSALLSFSLFLAACRGRSVTFVLHASLPAYHVRIGARRFSYGSGVLKAVVNLPKERWCKPTDRSGWLPSRG